MKKKQKKQQRRKEMKQILTNFVDNLGDVALNLVSLVELVGEEIKDSKTFSKAVKKGKYVAGAVQKVYNNVSYSSFKEALFTNGKFDVEKAKALLKNKGEAITQLGQKTVEKIEEMVQKGYDQAVGALFPTQKELNTIYSGIGTEYNGVLFKPDLDKVIAFYNEARKKLPKGLLSKEAILFDIKASASASKEELLEYYIVGNTKTLTIESVNAIKERVRTVQRYL